MYDLTDQIAQLEMMRQELGDEIDSLIAQADAAKEQFGAIQRAIDALCEGATMAALLDPPDEEPVVEYVVVGSGRIERDKPTLQQAMAEAAKEQVTCEGCGREMSKFGIGRHRAKCLISNGTIKPNTPATPAPLPAGAVVDLDMARALL